MRSRILGEKKVVINKMGGLLLLGGNTNSTILPWDTTSTDIGAILESQDGIIWDGTLFYKDEIDTIFPRFGQDGITPIPYRLRPGKLGASGKVKSLLRMRSYDADIGNFTLETGGGEIVRTIKDSIHLEQDIQLIIHTNSRKISTLLYSPEIFHNRAARLK